MNPNDETSVRLLVAALRRGDELQVLHVLHLAQDIPGVDWDEDVAPLLSHASPHVRQAALLYLGRAGNLAHSEAVAARFADPEAAVRATALEAYAAIHGPAAAERLAPYLEDASPRVRRAAVVGMLSPLPEPDIQLPAQACLRAMLYHTDPAMRQEAARALGALRLRDAADLLQPLLADASPAVRLSAIQAAGAQRLPDLVRPLIHQLAGGATAASAVEALSRYGAGIETQLSDALREPDVRLAVPAILRRLGTPVASELLAAQIEAPHPALRSRVLHALAEMSARGAAPDLSPVSLRRALRTEIRGAYALHVIHAGLADVPDAVLLDDALAHRQRAALERIGDLLYLLHPAQAEQLRQARAAGETGLPLPDDPEVRELLLPLWEDSRAALRENPGQLGVGRGEALTNTQFPGHFLQRSGRAQQTRSRERILEVARREFDLLVQSSAAQLRELAQSPDDWLRACALFHIGQSGRRELADTVLRALGAEAALVRESALAAGQRLVDREQLAAALRTVARGPAGGAASQEARTWLGELGVA